MTISINDLDFIENFDITKMAVGIIGFGYVGQAVESFFTSECKSYVYDKFKDGLDTLEDTVKNSHVIFVCVPTPMNKDGSCHTNIIESALSDIVLAATNLDRDLNDFVVVIKSTVRPGFTDEMREKLKLRLLFSPEFLTEASSIQDFENVNRVILGGDLEDARVVYKFFARKMDPKGVQIAQCESNVAEMVKLFTNTFLAIKVTFGNEIYQICEKLGIGYEEVMNLACLDNRIAYSHLNVPGSDSKLGFSGSCFPKDINNLRNVCQELNTGEKLFSATINRNNELRPGKDWEELKGRAVVDEEE